MGQLIYMFNRVPKEKQKKCQTFDFIESIENNIIKNQELKKKRARKNLSVLRSYRIKN